MYRRNKADKEEPSDSMGWPRRWGENKTPNSPGNACVVIKAVVGGQRQIWDGKIPLICFNANTYRF